MRKEFEMLWIEEQVFEQDGFQELKDKYSIVLKINIYDRMDFKKAFLDYMENYTIEDDRIFNFVKEVDLFTAYCDEQALDKIVTVFRKYYKESDFTLNVKVKILASYIQLYYINSQTHGY